MELSRGGSLLDQVTPERELHRCFHPTFLFLSKTKNNFSFLQDFMLEFGYDHLFTVDLVGRSGGLALYYMDASDVTVNFSNNRMIDIESQMEGHKVFMTFVYGDPVIEYRENVWEKLLKISANRTGAWLLMGDFNEITSNPEKKGGKKRTESSFLPFKSMLAGCGMIEFPFMGNSFSWARRTRAGRVQCRLDRAVGNEDWHKKISHTYVEYLLRWGSDHRPILERFQAHEHKNKRNFKFNRNWLSKEGFVDTVREEWENLRSDPALELYDKLSKIRQSISRWKRCNPTNNALLIEELKKQLDSVQNDDLLSSEEELEIKFKLCAAYREEELYWNQKS